ncbi:sensor histidine kinase [Breznakiella homolactica]|uniref:Histidine kinase n=1 Tax=Breznakiella homolactica TaxID=2798577 RepID=A0A7T8B9Q0_9SPIR|nr:histidine kinase [Breznakiella homolactica]QQO09844.1 histidine kinase [Breznakiella homolactica]
MIDLPPLSRFRFHGFREKILLAFFIFSFIPLVLVGYLSYRTAFTIARERILGTVESANNQLFYSINERISQMERVAESLQYYVYTLTATPEESITQYLSLYGHIRRFISSLEYSFNLLNIVVYLPDDNFISREGFMFRTLSSIEQLGLSPDHLLQSGIDLKWKLFLEQELLIVNLGRLRNVNYISCYRSIRNIATQKINAVYFVNISCGELSGILAELPIAPGLETCIIDRSGIVVAHSDESQIGTGLPDTIVRTVLKAEEGELFSLGSGQNIIMKTLGISDWIMVTFIPDSYIRDSSFVLIRILLIALILLIPVLFLLGIRLSRMVTGRIYTLGKTIRDFQTSENTELIESLSGMTSKPPRTRDEIDELAVDFVRMSERLEESFGKILDMKMEESRLKYKLLQSKINPHFLYNILESIKTAQTMGDISMANSMITKLAKFYRQLLRGSDDLIPIHDEAEMVSTYLEIESLCRRGSLEWSIHLDEGIGNFLICKFTLQPIVENCIIHGSLPGQIPLVISVAVEYADDQIRITVADNGVGMSKEQVSALTGILLRSQPEPEGHYGLWNVSTRLNLYSGGMADLKIKSSEGTGTMVIITMPQMFSEELLP